jgi:hypothetical protein
MNSDGLRGGWRGYVEPDENTKELDYCAGRGGVHGGAGPLIRRSSSYRIRFIFLK